jgi:aconitate hydratase
VLGLGDSIRPRQQVTLQIARKDGKTEQVPLILRIDTPIEVEYYRHGGILPFVLRDILQSKSSAA